jgi:hypothetical protein
MTQHRGLASATFALALLLVQFGVFRFSDSEALVRVVLPATIAAVPLALWLYRDRIGTWIIYVGVAANLAAILANGGLMPITRDTVTRAVGEERAARYTAGQWIPGSKDVLVPDGGGRLPELGDQIVIAAGRGGMAASPGDVVIWAGLMVLVAEFSWSWQVGRQRQRVTPIHSAEGGAATLTAATRIPPP